MAAKPPCERPCKGAFSYSQGLKGKNSDLKKILFIANRADSRLLQLSLFNSSHLEALLKSSTGKAFKEMLDFCGLSFDDIYFTNIFKCLLPGDRNPLRSEYMVCSRVLEEQVIDFSPVRIVGFGSKVYEFMFSQQAKKINFEKSVGMVLDYHSAPVLIENHPCKLGSIISKTREEHYERIADFIRNK